VEVRQQYWQVAVARRRATEQRCFLQGRIRLEKKLHEYHLAKSAKRRENSEAAYLVRALRKPNTSLVANVGIQSATAVRKSVLGGCRKAVGEEIARTAGRKVRAPLARR
jgi:hypothetical protein